MADGNLVPLRKAPVETPRERESAQVDRVTGRYIDEMGTKEALMMALRASSSPKAQRFLTMLADPKKSRWTIPTIARKSGLDLMEMAEIFRSRYASAALMNYFKGLPRLSADIIEDAYSTKAICPDCNGLGRFNPDPANERAKKLKCPRCQGSGEVRRAGDSDARKLVAEATGQIKSKSGINVSVNVGQVGIESVLDELDGQFVNVTPGAG